MYFYELVLSKNMNKNIYYIFDDSFTYILKYSDYFNKYLVI